MFNAMVSRPVGRKEMMEEPDAKASMRNEWLGQHKQRVYDFSIVREYDDVVAEAKREGKEVHMARVRGICVEKSYQLPKGSPGRKFKGRGVLLGNQVKNGTGRPHSSKISATHLLRSKLPDGQTSMVASPGTL